VRKANSILMLSPWPSALSMAGGGTPLVRDLVETLLDAGYSVDFVAPVATAGEQDWFPDHDRLRIHRYGPLRLAFPGYPGRLISLLERTLRLAARGVALAVRDGRPCIVYGLSSLTIPGAVCCGFVLRCPKVGALLGTFLFPQLERTLGPLGEFEEVIAFKSPVDRLVILNDGTRGDDVARALKVPDTRVRFWMHCLDLDACTAAMERRGRTELGLPAGVPLVVSTSRLVAWKRVDRMLRAAPDVLARCPDTLFVLSGEGPERGALEELVHDLSISHAVRFLGSLPRDVNLRLIASADVFCALYDYSCVGVALLEALGCGVAAVVADTGATRDFVEDGVSGCVVGPNDTRGTAAAIVVLAQDPELRARLGSEARQRAQSRFLTPEERASLELEMIAELTRPGNLDAPPHSGVAAQRSRRATRRQ
jgi:glycosyltransferase involved in cell wall biosynthesis